MYGKEYKRSTSEKDMNIIYTKSFDATYKYLKKYPKERKNLNDIKELVEEGDTFNDLINNPLAKMYSFEGLKHKKNGYYSFNLAKKGGVIRLIVQPSSDGKDLIFVFISFDHYKDFSSERVIFYDE